MNSGTKIVIIKSKHLIYTAIIALLIIILAIVIIIGLRKNDDTVTSAPVTYSAGIYTSSLVLNGNPVELQITLDKDKIKSIDLVNISESVTTMYPLIEPTLDDIEKQVLRNNSTQNISYSEDAQYTALILLEAIDFTLSKAIINDVSVQ